MLRKVILKNTLKGIQMKENLDVVNALRYALIKITYLDIFSQWNVSIIKKQIKKRKKNVMMY